MRAQRNYDEQVFYPYLCPMVSSYFRQSAPQEACFKFQHWLNMFAHDFFPVHHLPWLIDPQPLRAKNLPLPPIYPFMTRSRPLFMTVEVNLRHGAGLHRLLPNGSRKSSTLIKWRRWKFMLRVVFSKLYLSSCEHYRLTYFVQYSIFCLTIVATSRLLSSS